ILAGESVFATCSVPPRHGKTETILHLLVAYLLRYPHKTVAFVTYSHEQARRKSLRALQIARALGLKLGSSTASRDQADRASSTASYWQTREGGGFIAVGRNGALTGQGIDVLVIDDPLKNREEAESQIIRDKVWDFFTDTAYLRLEPGASMLIVHT